MRRDFIQLRSVEVSRSAVGLLRAQQVRLSAHAKLKGALSGKAEAVDGSYLAALQVQAESALQENPAVIIGLATASGAIPPTGGCQRRRLHCAYSLQHSAATDRLTRLSGDSTAQS